MGSRRHFRTGAKLAFGTSRATTGPSKPHMVSAMKLKTPIEGSGKLEQTNEVASKRVSWITNFVPPYVRPMFEELNLRFSDFRVLVSIEMETCRSWKPDMRGLRAQVQRTVSWAYSRRHPHGFSERIQVHVPYDTLPLLVKQRPDVVVSTELGARTLQAVLYRMFKKRSRLVIRLTVSEISELGRGWLRTQFRRCLLARADAVIVNGQSGLRYARLLRVPTARLFIVPYTTGMEPLLSLPVARSRNQALRLLYVGQLIERKGILQFVEALLLWAARNPERTVELWLVGDGDLRDQLERLPLEQNVTFNFSGSVAYAELPAIYAQAGILVFPTLADEWGVVVNEALAAGLPVLGSTFSQAVEELVREGHNGWTFRAEVNDIYAALNRALNTPESTLSQMKERARQSVAHLTPAYAADLVLDAVAYASQQ
jgi:glycosyltransferase involved in cell wall biosynthesis